MSSNGLIVPPKYKPLSLLIDILQSHMAAEQYQAAATVVAALKTEFDALDKSDNIVMVPHVSSPDLPALGYEVTCTTDTSTMPPKTKTTTRAVKQNPS